MISRRLKSVAGLVYQTDQVIDIGCDHALLDVYLIKHQLLNHVVVSDSNQNALQSGIKNIAKHKLTKQIDARLGYGLTVVDENINTAIISGMGTNTILKILAHPNLKYLNKLIIQSNNDYYLLRKAVCVLGFFISHESVVYDKGKYYINIVFMRGHKKYTFRELKYGPILMYANQDYFAFLLKKQYAILDYIPKYKIITRLKHRKETIYLRRLCK